MNSKLAEMGAEFAALRAKWSEMEPGEGRDDLCDLLNEKAQAIRAMPAGDLAGLAVKARAVSWTCNLDWKPLDENEQYFQHVMANFIVDVQRAAGMPNSQLPEAAQ